MSWICPVFNRMIDDGDCFDCSLAAEDFGSATTADRMKSANSNYESICLSCKHHPIMDMDKD